MLTAPTPEETLRVKAFLVVRRNQTRDYLDVAAMTDRYGIGGAATALARIDAYYADQRGTGDGVGAQLARQLADPRPRDISTTGELHHYKNLASRWHDWRAVREVCRALAVAMVRGAT